MTMCDLYDMGLINDDTLIMVRYIITVSREYNLGDVNQEYIKRNKWFHDDILPFMKSNIDSFSFFPSLNQITVIL